MCSFIFLMRKNILDYDETEVFRFPKSFCYFCFQILYLFDFPLIIYSAFTILIIKSVHNFKTCKFSVKLSTLNIY
jgi:hypothetical protein